jgi:hypothetical protein
VREIAELILRAQGKWGAIISRYIARWWKTHAGRRRSSQGAQKRPGETRPLRPA